MVLTLIDNESRSFLAYLESLGGPGLEEMSVAGGRNTLSVYLPFQGPLHPIRSRETLHLPARDGGAIRTRVYHPERSIADPPDTLLPCIVYFHGGGWVLGDLDVVDTPMRRLADRCKAVIVSVDYRLAPEFPFPTPIHDAIDATEGVFAHADRLGIDPTRVHVAGDSAGGNLAAVVALHRASQELPLAGQVLIYPVTDLTASTGSRVAYSTGHLLTQAMMDWFSGHYLTSMELQTNPEVSPLYARGVGSLPPSLVFTAECDPLRDEGIAYARRLADNGVEVSHVDLEGLIHGCFWFAGAVSGAGAIYEKIGEFVTPRSS